MESNPGIPGRACLQGGQVVALHEVQIEREALVECGDGVDQALKVSIGHGDPAVGETDAAWLERCRRKCAEGPRVAHDLGEYAIPFLVEPGYRFIDCGRRSNTREILTAEPVHVRLDEHPPGETGRILLRGPLMQVGENRRPLRERKSEWQRSRVICHNEVVRSGTRV